MKRKERYIDFTLEERIIHIILLKSFFLNDIGLMSGKMGILLALVEYNAQKSNKIYEDFISELIDDIWRNIHSGLHFGFADGLSGIGWGIEFLIQHKAICGTSIEICAEIDRKIMEVDLDRIHDTGLDTGLEGVLNYILVHIQNTVLQGEELPFDKTYRDNLYEILKRKECHSRESLQILIQQYLKFHVDGILPTMTLSLKPFISNIILDRAYLEEQTLGLRQGLAGALVKNTFNYLS